MSRHTDDRLGEAAQILNLDVRRWLLRHALKTGRVSSRDMSREFPGFGYSQDSYLKPMLRSGVLVPAEKELVKGQPRNRYKLGDISILRELHQWLGEFLQEVDAQAQEDRNG